MNKNKSTSRPWKRAIIHVDMNCFFAAIEQKDFPELHGKSVAVTNGEQGTCIITSSYEARAYGVKTGMRLAEAKMLCPNLIQRPARPHRYSEVSSRIMHALQAITPDIEIFSVDEAFLDVTTCQQLHGDPVEIGRMVKRCVYDASGLFCSVGVSGDKTTAKYAAKCQKPDGFTVILPCEAKARLKNVRVTELCGIANGVGRFLAQRGINYCGEIEKLPIGVLAKRFGNLGRRIWLMCQGADPDPIRTSAPDPKSMGHGKVIPPNTTDLDTIKTYLQHMSEKLASRLRHHNMTAKYYFVGIKSYYIGWIGGKYSTITPTNDGKKIYQLCLQMLMENWQGEGVYQVQITAVDPNVSYQFDLFESNKTQKNKLHDAIDNINDAYGEFTVTSARLLQRSKMPNVISPAWKPSGHRQTI